MRLGILGGTFNPIHLGHLVLAESAREQAGLDQVWFIPTATPPHKSPKGLPDGRTRLRLVRLAIRGHPAFRASGLELRLGGVSYTLRTVQWLRQHHPKARLHLIVGADMLRVHWYGMDALSRLCTFLVAQRPDQAGRPAGPLAAARRLRLIHMPQLDISSTMIRERVRRGRSIRYLVPEAAAREIARSGLYRSKGRARQA
jgi:nicotinate-nucleotide adenylyltransferase